MRVALIGGSFNPIHTDHLRIIQYCLHQLQFNAVWIIPNYQNPDKKNQNLIAIHHRLAMIRIAIQNLSKVRICRLETTATVHLTYQTINRLVKRYPTIKFSFCIGQDLLTGLEQWDRFAHMKTKVDWICFQRQPLISAAEQAVMNRHQIPIYQFKNRGLCSTMIRQGCHLTKQITAINHYINRHHLYLKPRLEYAQVNPDRIKHCFLVAQMARTLARHYHVNAQQAYLAGALHDITKNWTITQHTQIITQYGYQRILKYHPNTYHAWSAYLYLKHHLLIANSTILVAVRNHTVAGNSNHQHPLEKIIFIADKISADRRYPTVPLYRRWARNNLDWCYYRLVDRACQMSRKYWTSSDLLWRHFCDQAQKLISAPKRYPQPWFKHNHWWGRNWPILVNDQQQKYLPTLI